MPRRTGKPRNALGHMKPDTGVRFKNSSVISNVTPMLLGLQSCSFEKCIRRFVILQLAQRSRLKITELELDSQIPPG